VDKPYDGYWANYGGEWHWVLGAPPANSPKDLTDWDNYPDHQHNPASDPDYVAPAGDHDHPPYGGYWAPQHGGGWSWHPGKPPPYLVDDYGWDTITDGRKTPNGAANSDYDEDPAPPDVEPPSLSQTWGTNPPSITGNPEGIKPDDGSGDQISEPPHHPPYHVRPGQIRSAEVDILNQTQTVVSDYESLKADVKVSTGWNWGYHQDHGHLDFNGKMDSIQDNMLLSVADTIELAGQYVRALNNTAQFYAKADIDSFVPEE
jgi:hypothetical protein